MPPRYAEARNRVFHNREFGTDTIGIRSLSKRAINIPKTVQAIKTRRPSAGNRVETPRAESMNAIRIHSYGGPEVLHYEEVSRPRLRSGEVLIRVHAAGVNPLDWKVRSGSLNGHVRPKLPLIPGWDVSGVVKEVGQGVTQFKKGDEVFAMADPTRDGAYADYIAVREAALALKPKSLYHVRAAAVPLSALTAWQCLFDLGRLQPGQRVLIHGASGGVGHFAVQLAKWKGADVLATESTEDQESLRKLGADESMEYTSQRFEEVVRDIDIVLDTVDGDTQEHSWRVLKKGGVLVSLVEPPSKEKAEQFGVRGMMCRVQPNGAQLHKIAQLIDSAKLRPMIDRILPLTEARRAHELGQNGGVRGKIVLRVKNIAL